MACVAGDCFLSMMSLKPKGVRFCILQLVALLTGSALVELKQPVASVMRMRLAISVLSFENFMDRFRAQ